MHILATDVNGGTSYHIVSDTMLVLIGTTLHCKVLLFQGNSTNQLVILRLDPTTKIPRISGTVFCTRATGKNFIFFLVLSSDLPRWVFPLSVYVLPLGES